MVSKKMVYDRETRDEIKDRARKLRKNQSGAEYHLRSRLRKQKETKVMRQCVVGKLILDFGLPYRNLLVEVDDSSHEIRQDKDARRDAWLRNLGFNVIRVTNDEVFQEIDSVLDKISIYPVSDDNKIKFHMSIRAARSKSYWIEKVSTDD